MTGGLVLVAAFVVGAVWTIYGWVAGALVLLAIGCTFLATATAATRAATDTIANALDLERPDPDDPEDTPMSSPNAGQSRTATGVLSRRASRFQQLGLIRSCVPDDPDRPAAYTVVTAAGDVQEVARRDLPAYLDGLAHGHRAATAR